MVQDWITTARTLVVAIVLWQVCAVTAEPSYGLAYDVAGSQRLADGTERVANYLPSLAAAQLTTGTLTQTAFDLPALVDLLKQTGTHISEAGLSGTAAITALVAGESGSSTALFTEVLRTIDDGLDHLGQHLPATKTALVQLVGNNLPDRLTDSFGRVADGLGRLRALVVQLRDAVGAAVAEAGSELTVSADIVQRHITLRLVYDLVDAVQNLRAYLPLVRYTLTFSIQDALTADAFLDEYQSMVDSVDALLTPFITSLDTAQAGFNTELETRVQKVGTDFSNLGQSIEQDVAMMQVAERSAVIDAMLAAYDTALSDVDGDVESVGTTLQAYMEYVEQLLATGDDELMVIDSSELISTLVHTLIDCGPYGRYCFHKHEQQVADLLEALLSRTSLCVEREEHRITNLRTAAGSLLENIRYDFDDVLDLLLVCDSIADTTDQEQCLTTISGSITPLGPVFADKYGLLYDLTDTELAASKQRIKMCVELSVQLFTERYIPDLRADIDSCAADGPNAD